MNTAKSRGFTLIELMIVVAIVGILAAVAFPLYVSQTAKVKRTDGQSALLAFAAAMERHATVNSSYLGAAEGGANTGKPGIFYNEAPADGSEKYYDLTINAATANSYTLRATPKNAMAGDGILEYTSTHIKRWDRNKNGVATDAGENKWE